MVRLEEIIWFVRLSSSEISIPVWCDWECLLSLVCRVSFPFQFQYGAIGRIYYQFDQNKIDHFNSSMVRLGENLTAILIFS